MAGKGSANVRPARRLAVQYACEHGAVPGKGEFRTWLNAALEANGERAAEITVRIVAADEGLRLARDYRGSDHPTNVLSFAYERQPAVHGDLVLCAPVVAGEAAEQGKALAAHYAHLTVHGLLHLLGFDHEESAPAAAEMEEQERKILATLGYPDPYRDQHEGGDEQRQQRAPDEGQSRRDDEDSRRW